MSLVRTVPRMHTCAESHEQKATPLNIPCSCHTTFFPLCRRPSTTRATPLPSVSNLRHTGENNLLATALLPTVLVVRRSIQKSDPQVLGPGVNLLGLYFLPIPYHRSQNRLRNPGDTRLSRKTKAKGVSFQTYNYTRPCQTNRQSEAFSDVLSGCVCVCVYV